MTRETRIFACVRTSASVSAAMVFCGLLTPCYAQSPNYSYPAPETVPVATAAAPPEIITTRSGASDFHIISAPRQNADAPEMVQGGSELHILSSQPIPKDEALAGRPSPYVNAVTVTAQPVARPPVVAVNNAPVAPRLPLNINASAMPAAISADDVPAPVLTVEPAIVTAGHTSPASFPLVIAQQTAQNGAASAGSMTAKVSSGSYMGNLGTLSPASGPTTVAAATPAPVLLQPPLVRMESSAAAPVIPAIPAGLSPQSRAIADMLPPEKISAAKKPPVQIEHEQKNPLDNQDVREHKGVGITISIHKPRPNISHMLEEAYDALIAGNQEDAVALYKQVLEEQPQNKLALFGLATTYHRAGQLQLARPLYGKLLAIDPHNEEGLNNFLVLLSDESPTEALDEMKKLEHTHPDFSPLPAQMAVIYQKMGDYQKAIASMNHAIELSPENIKYRYDMAVILDKSGDWNDAAVYYQQLITADARGEKIPANSEEIQERLTFIRSNKPKV